VIEGGTAALLAPYLDRPGFRGELNLPPARLDSLVHALDAAGFKVHVHAIGDRAIRVALDAFEKLGAPRGGPRPRHIIAHLQLFDPADVDRFAKLGVVASFQPLWAYRDSYIIDLTEPRLGPERSRRMYPIASVVKSGAIVAAGSDWSVSSLDPLAAMQVAVTRRALEDSTGVPWIPEERVDLATIIRAYTAGGAMASDQDSLIGTIEIGRAADLIVLSENIFALPVHRIHTARVLLTLLSGREVFRDSVAIGGGH
jgi:predicted amidohydrolase YtcJ